MFLSLWLENGYPNDTVVKKKGQRTLDFLVTFTRHQPRFFASATMAWKAGLSVPLPLGLLTPRVCKYSLNGLQKEPGQIP